MALQRSVTADPPHQPSTGRTPEDRPVSESQSRIAGIFTSETTDARVMIAHGYGIRVGLWNGHLEVSDGIGRYRRTRKVPKADHQLQRLVITASEGYLTLAALRWCREHGVSVNMLDNDGDLVASHTPEPPARNVVSQLRVQALSGSGGPLEAKGVEVGRYLLEAKLRGQAANLVKLLDRAREARRIDHNAGLLADAATYTELTDLERWSANTYFSAWQATNVHIPWSIKDLEMVPQNWLSYERRSRGTVNSSKRYATDPVNALLNYAYTIGYSEARIAASTNLSTRDWDSFI